MNIFDSNVTVFPHFAGSVVVCTDDAVGDIRIAAQGEASPPPLEKGDELDIPEALFLTPAGMDEALEGHAGGRLTVKLYGRRLDLRGKGDLLKAIRTSGRSLEIHLYDGPDDAVPEPGDD